MLLITTPNVRGEVKILGKAASALGWDTFCGGWRIPEYLKNRIGAVYGEQFFCEAVAEQMNWTLLSNPLDWLVRLPEEYTQRKIDFMTLAEARHIKEKRFIKPADDKTFKAMIYESGDELSKNPLLDDVPTLVSDIMNFTSEYRCFIKNRKVISICCYSYKKIGMTDALIDKEEHYHNNNDAVIEFVNKMFEDERVDCAPGAVIDVGRFKKDTYAVIESNPVWASGIYGCELVAALDAIKTACIANKNETK